MENNAYVYLLNNIKTLTTYKEEKLVGNNNMSKKHDNLIDCSSATFDH